MDELAIIAAIQATIGEQQRLTVGLGDDCAVLSNRSTGWELITQDVLMDGAHFITGEATAQQIAQKCLGVNLSDIAAMGGTPDHLSLGLCLPRTLPEAFITEWLREFTRLCRHYHVAITGGDTNFWDGPLVVAVCLSGRAARRGPILRSSAQVGDHIFVSGPLGSSLSSGHHLSFTPRLDLGQSLADGGLATAMIDLSDGLGTDLRHILKASAVGASLDPDAIPLRDNGALTAQQRLAAAFCDGEDFELCFTVRPENLETLAQRVPAEQRINIGVITNQRGKLQWTCGEEIRFKGFEHVRNTKIT